MSPDASCSGLSAEGGLSRITRLSSCWMTRRRICWLSGCSTGLLVLALLLVFLWPRQPDWQLQELVVSPDALNSVIQAVTNPSDKVITVDMDARANFSNPNFIGAEAGKGHFVVTWEGHELASVVAEPGVAPARSHEVISAHSTSVITPDLGKLLMSTLPGKGFEFQVNLKGKLPATVKALFGLKVQVSLECLVDVSVLKIMSEPEKLVTGHKCTYGVGF